MGWLADKRRRKHPHHFTREVFVALRRIETQRLIIRWPEREDTAGFAATIDDELARINGWTPDHVSRMRSPVSLTTHPGAMITTQTDGHVLGWVTVGNFDSERRSCELGWHIGAEFRRQYYATEAVSAAVYALHSAGVASVIAGTATTNEPVQRMMKRLGARYTGQRDHTLPNGQLVPSNWYVFDGPGG